MISMRAVTVCQEMERGEKEERARAVPGEFGAGPEVKERESAELELRSGGGEEEEEEEGGGIPVCSVQGQGAD